MDKILKKYNKYEALVKTDHKIMYLNEKESLEFIKVFVVGNWDKVNLFHEEEASYITIASREAIEDWYNSLSGHNISTDMIQVIVDPKAKELRALQYNEIN